MATWNSRGLRGLVLEEMINLTNERYREKNLALVQKIPTSIKPVQFDKEHRHITLAYFDQKSTVYYIGAVQGIPVCFDAKECASDTFPLQNIHDHQIAFMRDFEQQGGVSFLLIYFSKHHRCYYLRFEKLMEYWQRQYQGQRKNFKFHEMEPEFEIPIKNATFVHYLETLNQDLLVRKKKS